MPRQLTISPTPYKSSFLSIPPSPFSPQLPVSPATIPSKESEPEKRTRCKATVDLLPPPAQPLHWLWQCHKCNRIYQLRVTRRCLDDGHFFCAGTTVVKRSKRNGSCKNVLRHQACASEFDYSGWKAWGTWRRRIAEQLIAAEALMRAEEEAVVRSNSSDEKRSPLQGQQHVERAREYWERNDVVTKSKRKDCWRCCDYPSECRWGKQFGVQTPVLPSISSSSSAVVEPSSPEETKKENEAKITFRDILLDIAHQNSSDHVEHAPTTCASNSHDGDVKVVTEAETHVPSVQQLVISAVMRSRRKHKSQSGLPLIPSPLAAHPPSPEDEKEDTALAVSQFSTVQRRAVDDSELEIKKGYDLSALQQRADAFVQSWRSARLKFQAVGSGVVQH